MVIASIRFLPVCENCGTVLYGHTVELKERTDLTSHRYDFLACSNFYQVNPPVCPKCGCYFDSITMPTKLPFECPDFGKMMRKG